MQKEIPMTRKILFFCVLLNLQSSFLPRLTAHANSAGHVDSKIDALFVKKAFEEKTDPIGQAGKISIDSQKVQKALTESKPSIVKIQITGLRYELIRNGQPYFIKGAGGTQYLDKLKEAGGNSIRTWNGTKEDLDKANAKNLTVCVGLSMKKPRHRADYKDIKMLKAQRSRLCNKVSELKDHPALLLWAIGNEVELQASHKDSILVWKEIETIAKMIKDIDSNHPIITVVSGAGKKLEDIKKYCPTIDAIGINSYGKLGRIPDEIKRYSWKKPYIVTEFGPVGWWESEKTDWGTPIEETSTGKSMFYRKVYTNVIHNKTNCLGSYVFLWGNKQEKTHTWFNMFLQDGSPTEMVDTMTLLWTGKWPDNRAPQIGKNEIYTMKNNKSHIYHTGSKVTFKLQAQDPDGDQLTIKWDIRKDESDNSTSGGDWERRIPPIEEAILLTKSNYAVINMPQQPGYYRIFAYAYDPSGKVATANLPIKVK